MGDNRSPQSEPLKPRRITFEESVERVASIARKYPHRIEFIPILEDLRKLLEIKKAGRLGDGSSHDMIQYVHYAMKRVNAGIRERLAMKSSNSNPEEKLA